MKKLFAFLMSVVMCLSVFTGCVPVAADRTEGSTDDSMTEPFKVEGETTVATDVVEDDTTEGETGETGEIVEDETEATEPEVVEKPDESESENQLSDNLFSFQISIDGTVIQLPCNVADLTALGWKIDDNKAENPLADGYTTGVNVYHEDGSYITLSIYNISGETVTFANAMVDDVSIHGRSLGGHEIFICKGLSVGSTKDEVVAVYGNEPSYDYVSDDGSYSKLEYEGNNFRNKITFSFKDDIVSDIDICTG